MLGVRSKLGVFAGSQGEAVTGRRTAPNRIEQIINISQKAIDRGISECISPLEEVGRNFVFSLLLLVILDMFTSPYQGLIHDARLYALQALSHVNPASFKQDLFFLFGSQDKFTVFSFVLLPLIKTLGLQPGMYLGYLCSRVLFLGSVLSLNRQLVKHQGLALLASLLLASGPLHYIFFDVNEPFLTPRLASCAFCLLGVRALLRHAHWCLGCFLLLAGMLHPIMALGPSLIAALVLILRHSRRPVLWIITVAGVVLAAFVIGVVSDKSGLLPKQMMMDSTWRDIMIERSWFLAPHLWTRSEWEAMAASIVLLSLAMNRLQDTDAKHLIVTTLLVSIAGIVLTVLLTYLLPVALLLQAQPWRFVWILRLLTPTISLLLAAKLWQGQGWCQLVAPLILLPTMIGGGVNDDSLYLMILAGAILALPARLATMFNRKMVYFLVVMEGIVIFAPNLMMIGVNIVTLPQWAEPDDSKLNLIPAALNPLWRVAIVSLCILWLMRRTRMAERVIEAVLFVGLLFWVQPNLSRQSVEILSQRKSNALAVAARKVMREWQGLIPSGSMVLSDGVVEPEMIWFEWQSCSYISRLQGAGVIFNRALALEWARRQAEIQERMTRPLNDLAEWCQKEKIDFVVSRQALPLVKMARSQGLNLYAVADSASNFPVARNIGPSGETEHAKGE